MHLLTRPQGKAQFGIFFIGVAERGERIGSKMSAYSFKARQIKCVLNSLFMAKAQAKISCTRRMHVEGGR